MRAKIKYNQKGSHEARTTLFSSKKGQILQIAYFMVILLACAFTILTVKYIIDEFHDGVNEAGYNTTVIKEAQSNIVVGWQMSDFAFIMLTFGLFALLIFTSFKIPTHPVFMVINVFGIFFLVFIGMIMSNFYGEVVAGEDAVYSEQAETFEIMNFIMSYLPFMVAGIIFVTSLLMYIRGRGQYG